MTVCVWSTKMNVTASSGLHENVAMRNAAGSTLIIFPVSRVVLLLCSGPPNPDNLPEDGKLKSEMMTKDNRRYYLDLKENSRGRFLRVSSGH